jgi:hypothetical protein
VRGNGCLPVLRTYPPLLRPLTARPAARFATVDRLVAGEECPDMTGRRGERAFSRGEKMALDKRLHGRINRILAHCHYPLHTSLLEGITNKIKSSSAWPMAIGRMATSSSRSWTRFLAFPMLPDGPYFLGHPWGTPATVRGLAGSPTSQEARFCWDFGPQESPRIVGDSAKTHS